MQNENRIETFDIMKGFAILLMILGHLFGDAFPNMRHIIYSFHMPLFFILAGYFTNRNSNKTIPFISKNAIRLLLPYLVTMVLLVIWGVVIYLAKGNPSLIEKYLKSLLWSGYDISDPVFGTITIGPMWFLLALFWTRLLFFAIVNYGDRVCGKMTTISANKKYCRDCMILILCIVLSFVSYNVFCPESPFYLFFLQGVFGLGFYSIGWFVRNHCVNKIGLIISILCWPISIIWGGTDMWSCYHRCFIIDIIGACVFS